MAKETKKKGRKDREEYLEACAGLLCKAAYRMCKEYFSSAKTKDKCDPKLLKEACSAVKEAVAVSSGLADNKESTGEEIRIMFSVPEEYSQ